jgi:hypothetical protein
VDVASSAYEPARLYVPFGLAAAVDAAVPVASQAAKANPISIHLVPTMEASASEAANNKKSSSK